MQVHFEIEFSWEKTKFFILVRRTLNGQKRIFLKTIWLKQAKQLIKLFEFDLYQMVNGLIKVKPNFEVDFTFIDKTMLHMNGINRDVLSSALNINPNRKQDEELLMSRNDNKLNYSKSSLELPRQLRGNNMNIIAESNFEITTSEAGDAI